MTSYRYSSVLKNATPLLLAPAFSLLICVNARAGNTWDGEGTPVSSLYNWSDNLNWNSNTLPTYSTLLTYGGVAGLTSNNNGATSSIAGITFSATAGSFVLSGSSVTLGGNITNNSTNLQTINLPLVLDANRTIATANANVILGGTISGAFNLIKNSGNTLTMNTAGSSFSRMQINTGTVSLGVNDALPTNGGLTFANAAGNAILALNGKTQTLGSTLVFAGSDGVGTATISGMGLLKLGGDISKTTNKAVTISSNLDLNGATRTFTLDHASATFTVSGEIANSIGNAGITKAGIGTLTLSGVNSFTGGLTVNVGSVATETTGTFGSGDVTVASGAFLTSGNSSSFFDNGQLTFSRTSAAGSINLNFLGSDTIGSVFESIGGTSLPAGTYNAGQLNTFFSGGNAVFTGTGSLFIAAIPEPSAFAALAGLGALGLTATRRRRHT